jgi:hypothetical protein
MRKDRRRSSSNCGRKLLDADANRRELQKSLDLAWEMLRLAEGGQDKMSLLWAHYCLGHTLSMRGELEAARAHTEQSMALYDFDRSRECGYVLATLALRSRAL